MLGVLSKKYFLKVKTLTEQGEEIRPGLTFKYFNIFFKSSAFRLVERGGQVLLWFKPKTRKFPTRVKPSTFCEVEVRLGRYRKIPISYLTNLLNNL